MSFGALRNSLGRTGGPRRPKLRIPTPPPAAPAPSSRSAEDDRRPPLKARGIVIQDPLDPEGRMVEIPFEQPIDVERFPMEPDARTEVVVTFPGKAARPARATLFPSFPQPERRSSSDLQ